MTISGGFVGGMMDVDRITRPSIQYVAQVKEHGLVEDAVDGD